MKILVFLGRRGCKNLAYAANCGIHIASDWWCSLLSHLIVNISLKLSAAPREYLVYLMRLKVRFGCIVKTNDLWQNDLPSSPPEKVAPLDAPFFLSRQLRVLRFATESADSVPNSNRPWRPWRHTYVADKVHCSSRGEINHICICRSRCSELFENSRKNRLMYLFLPIAFWRAWLNINYTLTYII